MQLYFLRHGEADWPDWKKSDDERPLTDFGKKEMRDVAKFLARLNVRLNLIVTSASATECDDLPSQSCSQLPTRELKSRGRSAKKCSASSVAPRCRSC